MHTVSDMHATLIGISQYGEGIARLRGPEQRVLEYATWCVQSGVDPAEVSVFLSDPGGYSGETTGQLAALGIPPDNVRAAVVEEIRSFVLNVLPAKSATNLMWLWSGHGFESRNRAHRVLLCADSSETDPRAYLAAEIMLNLRSERLEGLRRQLLLFDISGEGVSLPISPVWLPLPERLMKASGGPDSFSQVGITFASDHAQPAASGEFGEVLRLLQSSELDEWPPPIFEQLLVDSIPAGSHSIHIGHDFEVEEPASGVPDTTIGSPYVFVSYARIDRGYVQQLCEHLVSAGVKVWFDREIKHGSRFTTVIRDAIDQAVAFVVVMSPEAEKSTEVELELLRAQDEGIPVLPILLSGKRFFRVGALHYDDVTDRSMPSKEFVQRLRELAQGSGGPS